MVAAMARGVRLYLVGSVVLVSLAGCGRGFFQTAEREPWRAEAEVACLKSGVVKENAEMVRIDPIAGPGVCGAEFPLKVSALGEPASTYGFADDNLRRRTERRICWKNDLACSHAKRRWISNHAHTDRVKVRRE